MYLSRCVTACVVQPSVRKMRVQAYSICIDTFHMRLCAKRLLSVPIVNLFFLLAEVQISVTAQLNLKLQLFTTMQCSVS